MIWRRDTLGLRAEKGHNLADSCLIVPQASVSHPIGFPLLEFVQPKINFFKRLTEQGQRFPAMFFRGPHI